MIRVWGVVCTLLLHIGFSICCGLIFPELGGGKTASMKKLLDLTLHSAQEVVQHDKQVPSERLLLDMQHHTETPQKPAVKLISPVKRDSLLVGRQVPPSDETKRRIYFGGGILKQGNEIRLNLRAIGAMDFGKKDFYGTYKMSKEDLVLEIKPWGDELILEIPKLKLRRPLKPVGKFIWTYGPSFSESEPVEGSITFFPHHKDKTSLPSRVMWMGKEPPMHIGEMQNWK